MSLSYRGVLACLKALAVAPTGDARDNRRLVSKKAKKKSQRRSTKSSSKAPRAKAGDPGASGSASSKPSAAKATATEPVGEGKQSRSARGGRLWLYLLPPFLIAGIYLGLANLLGWSRGAESAPISGTESRETVDGDALGEAPQLLGRAIGKQQGGKTIISARFSEPNHGVYIAYRKDGSLLGDGWRSGGTVREALTDLAKAVVKRRPKVKGADSAELCIAHSFRQIDRDRRSSFSNIHRGIRGLELETSSGNRRISPTTMIAFNFKFDRALEYLAKAEKLRAADISDDNLRTFECDQILSNLDTGTAVTMFRGNTVVPIATVNRKTTEAFRDGMIDWLVNHVHPDGRMTYKWWPSQGKEAGSNNMIRQWMATAALGKIGHDRNDEDVFDKTEKNIDYNLSKFYREDPDGRGYIFFNGKAKLGAMALAAYSIYIHPNRQKWAIHESAILKTINSLLLESGRYHTFHLPKGRHDNENFYPGETQLYLTTRYVDERDPDMLERIMRAFRYYRQWHRDNRNPAFIPWHTQAYWTLWEVTKDDELKDFIFEMNDWLVDTMQQWRTAKTPDARGRFYNPRRRYGPPHASSTGVYLEGLIDAYQLARAVGDEKRRKKYARAMVRGLRSSMQLQFVDDIDMFYIKKKDRVRGGMRTTVYDNAIRVDNVQHTLMGVLKIVHEVSPEDWKYGVTE